ncbi:MAG: competence protein ComK [Bacilli bacterium]|nr:competence protein ComK [Bacilli bacterium]MDD4076533.1 competence protein ComK [Bacilli bacterium]MDD4387863.1 competence protein ComK [Bacilli bacterium]
MNKNTLYFYQYDNELLEINIDYRKIHHLTPTQLFNKLLLKEMTTLKGRLEAIKLIFSYSYNIPIYINQDMVFFKVFGKDKIWVNGSNVSEIKNRNDKGIIIFKCGKLLETTKTYRTLKNIYHKVLEVKNYKNDLFSV